MDQSSPPPPPPPPAHPPCPAPPPPPPPSPGRPSLRHPAPAPPHVRRGDEGEHRQEDQHRAPGVASGFLVQDGDDHVLLPADEPSDPRQDRAPHERAQAREGDELPEVHPRQAGRQGDQVPYDG